MGIRARTLAAIVGLVAVGAFWLFGPRVGPSVMAAVASARAHGAAGPVVFVVIYALAVVALIPGSVVTVAGGTVFGLLPGAAYSVAGAILGSMCAFLMGRYVAKDAIAARLASMPRLAAIERAVSREGRRIVLFLRLSPVMPFNVLNYALGLTTISLRDFLMASLIGMAPGTLAYAYAGVVAGEALALTGQAQVARDASYYTLLAAGFVATATATMVVAAAARRGLRDV